MSQTALQSGNSACRGFKQASDTHERFASVIRDGAGTGARAGESAERARWLSLIQLCGSNPALLPILEK